MKKHTTINLDVDVYHEAAQVLGTEQASETINRALAEVINYDKRKRLVARRFPDLTLELLKELRGPR